MITLKSELVLDSELHSVFYEILRRRPKPDEVADVEGLGSLLRSLIESKEARSYYGVGDTKNLGEFIKAGYRAILKRDPNMFEEAEWRAKLAFKKTSREAFLEILWRSPEHQEIAVPSTPLIFDENISEIELIWPRWWEPPVISLKRRRDSGLNLFFYGDPISPTGYSTGCRELLIELYKLGVNIRLFYTSRKMYASWREHTLPKYLLDLFHQLERTPIISEVSLQYWVADFFSRRSQYNIGWTYWELTRLPPSWVIRLNRMNEVMTCSNFTAEAFIKSGVRVPVTVTPHGVRGEIFGSPSIPECEVVKNGRKIELPEFVIVTNFQWDERKNPRTLIRGFLKAFKPSDDVALLILTYWGSSHRFELRKIVQMIAKIRAELGIGEHPPIYVTNQFAPSPYHVACFYKLGSLFALPSRGEGWGFPYIECMAMGIPCVATKWSGNMEFMNDDVAFLIKVKQLVSPRGSRWPQIREAASNGALWAEPDEDHFVELLRYAYNHPEHTKNVGAKARSFVLEHFPWSRGAEILYKRLERAYARLKTL